MDLFAEDLDDFEPGAELVLFQVSASVANGSITAAVDLAGRLVEVQLEEQVRGWPAADIAKAVHAAADQARAALSCRSARLA